MTPIVIAFTSNYIVPAATLVQSVLRSSKGNFEFICLTEETITEKEKELLKNLSGDRVVWKFLEKIILPEGVYIDPRYGAAAEYRLLLPELLPGYSKLIYIDCDIVVRNDLERLFLETQLGENLVAAVYEAPIENQAEEWARLGCNPGKYFNSGFLVLNLERMRDEKTSAKLISTLQSGTFEFPDQDVLNVVCKGRVLALPPIWNSIRTFRLPQYKADFLKIYSGNDWEIVRTHGNVHYTGGKPWNILAVDYEIWWKEYYSLPEAIRQLWTPGIKHRILSRIYTTNYGRRIMEGLRSAARTIKGKL